MFLNLRGLPYPMFKTVQ
ncbi:hypothetical protein GBAR_LOCUS5401 [Geodia barretti]|uniref:Uncharacterized protein n=1 Tax=Geodia barretti TaxID=519541 RepID=A0AA35RBQ0_GEOBA|nr:hypothetical protein GBAR_LOCUS5401 [Geodia barretti]